MLTSTLKSSNRRYHRVLQEQLFFSHVHNPSNLTTGSRRLAQSFLELADDSSLDDVTVMILWPVQYFCNHYHK